MFWEYDHVKQRHISPFHQAPPVMFLFPTSRTCLTPFENHMQEQPVWSFILMSKSYDSAIIVKPIELSQLWHYIPHVFECLWEHSTSLNVANQITVPPPQPQSLYHPLLFLSLSTHSFLLPVCSLSLRPCRKRKSTSCLAYHQVALISTAWRPQLLPEIKSSISGQSLVITICQLGLTNKHLLLGQLCTFSSLNCTVKLFLHLILLYY